MDRVAWLKERQSGIGGTDAAALCGVGFSSPERVYEEKVSPEPIDRPANLRMRLGAHTERLALDLYPRTVGVVEWGGQRVVRDPRESWRFCSPDGFHVAGPQRRLLEVKTLWGYPSDEWGEAGTDQLPDEVLIQVQHSLDVCLAAGEVGDSVADVVVLCPAWDDVRIYHVELSTRLLAPLVELERSFWGCVVSRSGVEGWESPLRAAVTEQLRRINPDTAIDLEPEAAVLVEQYERAQAAAKDAEASKKAARARLELLLDGREVGRLDDGRRVRQKVTSRGGYAVAPTTYVDFRILKAKKDKTHEQ
jgi:putative phage-type endonuclease